MSWTFFNSSGEALVQHAESEATQAEMEAETAGAKFVPPDLIKHSPGVAKAWAKWEQVGSHSKLASFNVDTTIDGTQAGDTDIVWNVAFSSIEYAILVSGDAGQYGFSRESTQIAAGTTIEIRTIGDVAQDSGGAMVSAFGVQA